MNDLPPGWAWAALGEIAETKLGKMLDRGKPHGLEQVPYLRNVNVQWGCIDLHDVLTMEMSCDEQRRFEIRPGDLLVCEGGEIGRCAIWPGTSGFMAFQKALHRIRPLGDIDARYIRWALEYMALSGMLLPYATGSTIKHLPQVQLRRLPMRVPPISEQRRIVDTLEDHISLLEAGDALLRVAGQRLRALWQSVLDAAHRGVLVAKRESGQSWRSMAAGDIGQVQGGIQKQPRRRPAANPFPFLRVANVTRAGLNLSEVHEIELFDGEPDRYLLKAGDLLVVEGNGSADQIGRAAMWHGDITRARTRIT